MPTFVECKRHDDTRARREVVGQMLDYVANGSHYWNAADIKDHAEQSASCRSKSVLSSLGPRWTDDVDAYFKVVETNLREGKVRMVFLLEDSSYELRSIVEFLNDQMPRVEVLLVEVRQYKLGEQRIVVPTLFGFTEKARMEKRDAISSLSGGGRRTWDFGSFIADATTRLTGEQLEAIRRVVRASDDYSWDIKFGTGKETGSLSVRIPNVAKRSILTIWSNGLLTINFGWLNETEIEEQIRDSMAEFVTEYFQEIKLDNYKERYVSVPPSVWVLKVEELIKHLSMQQMQVCASLSTS